MPHPSRQTLTAFVAGDLESSDTQDVVRHLLAGCSECKRITSRLWPVVEERESQEIEFRFDRLRSREKVVDRERDESSELLQELDAHPPNRRMLLIINSQRFHNWFLAELVLERTVELFFDDPQQAVTSAELAVALADRLPAQRYSEALVNDMRARAHGALANARRITSDFVTARDTFTKAFELLETGTGDPLEEARLLGWRAAYYRTRRELKLASRAYDRAIAIYRRVGDPQRMGQMMIDKASTVAFGGDYASAIRLTEKGLEQIDPDVDPRLALAAKHNLSLYLHREGDVGRAMDLVQELLPVYVKQNDTMVLLRLRWLEGRLAQAQREFDRAESAFREVQRGFIDHEIPYEAASVSFDLATVLLEQGRFDELAHLASDIMGIFRGLALPRYTLAALELFKTAIRAQDLSVSWITELAAYVDGSRGKPGSPFKPSS